jgi:hypothetical protein
MALPNRTPRALNLPSTSPPRKVLTQPNSTDEEPGCGQHPAPVSGKPPLSPLVGRFGLPSQRYQRDTFTLLASPTKSIPPGRLIGLVLAAHFADMRPPRAQTAAFHVRARSPIRVRRKGILTALVHPNYLFITVLKFPVEARSCCTCDADYRIRIPKA